MIIETERLFLREMKKDDFKSLYNVLADTEIMKYYPYAFDEAKVKSWIERNDEVNGSRRCLQFQEMSGNLKVEEIDNENNRCGIYQQKQSKESWLQRCF